MKAGKKKGPETVCGKKGAFTDSTGSLVFCTVHAKVLSATHLNTHKSLKSPKDSTVQVPCAKDSTVQVPCTGKIIPSKEMSMTTIKKMKLEDLKSFCKTHCIAFAESDKKPDICAKAETAIKERTLVPIKPVKQNANHVHLVEIGKQIRIQMNQILKVQRTDGFEHPLDAQGPLSAIKVDIVILENQISPIAGRMNTIQGMLAQYFIMRDLGFQNDISLIPKIEFISSSGKLKDYKGPSGGTTDGCSSTVPKEPSTDGSSSKTTYKDHKRDGIAFCRDFMTKNEGLITHRDVFDASAKKDDLADCFLQGIYYLKREKLITYSEDLEIKVV